MNNNQSRSSRFSQRAWRPIGAFLVARLYRRALQCGIKLSQFFPITASTSTAQPPHEVMHIMREGVSEKKCNADAISLDNITSSLIQLASLGQANEYMATTKTGGYREVGEKK